MSLCTTTYEAEQPSVLRRCWYVGMQIIIAVVVVVVAVVVVALAAAAG